MNIGSLFSRHATYRPDHLAVVFKDKRLTHREFNRSINCLANALLEMGIQKGDKIATVLPNCLELLEVYWAVAKIGAVVVPCSTLLMEKALNSLLRDSDTVLVVIEYRLCRHSQQHKFRPDGHFRDRYLLTDGSDRTVIRIIMPLKQRPAIGTLKGSIVNDADPFNIMYSSGTTGLPKGIVHTHYIRAMYGTIFAGSYRMTPESVTMHAGAIVFNGAFVDLMPTMFIGATYVLLDRFDPVEYIDTVAREKGHPCDAGSGPDHRAAGCAQFYLRKVQFAGNDSALGRPPASKSTRTQLNRRLPGRFYELYGLTEGFVTILDKFDYPAKAGFSGRSAAIFRNANCGRKRAVTCRPGKSAKSAVVARFSRPAITNVPI